MSGFRSWILLLVCSILAWPGMAFDPAQDVKLSVQKGALRLEIPEGVHVTEASVGLAKGSVGTLKSGPLPKPHGADAIGTPYWKGSLSIPLQGEGLAPQVSLEVTYMTCEEGEGGACFPPTSQVLKVRGSDIPKLVRGEAPPQARQDEKREALEAIPSKPGEAFRAEAFRPSAPAALQADAAPQAPAQRRSLFWMLLAAFGWGLAASLTPCVYPMIPITMAIIGAKGGGKAKGFLLSFSLVLGMAVTYTALGVAASLSGAAFGAFAQKPAFLIPVSLLFGAFALSLFGAFEIQLPMALQQRLQGGGSRQGLGGAFVMGLVLGPLAAPCVGPFVGTVLVDIAKEGSVALGALNLFIFALGMGVLFMAVGTFSAGLPKSGNWMIRFKQIMGLLVLGFAVWNVRLLLPVWALFMLQAVLLLIGAAVFGLFENGDGLWGQLRRAFSILLLVMGVLNGVRGTEELLGVRLLGGGAAAVEKKEPQLAWIEQDFEAAKARAKTEGKLVLVDVYAEWCVQCKELDEKTWPDPRIQDWIQANAIPVRLDTDAKRKDLAAKFEIRGYPTVILLDAEGREVRPRLFGFLGPEKMLAWLKGLPSK